MRRSVVAFVSISVAALAFAVYRQNEQMKAGNDLAGKRALVFGGTKGIGLGLAKHFAARSAHVTVVGRDAGTAVAELDALSSPGRNGFVRADLSQMATSEAVVREYLAASGGKLDLLVLSPGIATFQGYTSTPEGLDVKMALHYYSRVAAALAVREANRLHFFSFSSSLRRVRRFRLREARASLC
jgi:NAD(P)-dependent dehydrogenase (short-subunit alcohol dehydrogenase family)